MHGRLFPVALLALIVALPPAPAAGQTSAPSPTPNLAQWRAYHDALVTTASALPANVPLPRLLGPVLAVSDTRSADGDALAETQAALLTLTFYVNGWPLAALVPEARTWPAVPRRAVSLRGRGDLAQHFTVSALLATMAGEPMAAMIGLYKELRDARGGSGFSFSDLAADRAGTRFGQLAADSRESARRLHALVAAGLTENDIMPVVTGLPDNLPDAEFTRRFGGLGGAGYTSLVAEIERRVAELPLLRAFAPVSPPAAPEPGRDPR